MYFEKDQKMTFGGAGPANESLIARKELEDFGGSSEKDLVNMRQTLSQAAGASRESSGPVSGCDSPYKFVRSIDETRIELLK